MRSIRLLLKKLIEKVIYSPLSFGNDCYTSGRILGIQNAEFEGKNGILDGCNFSGNVKIGYATTLGYNNVMHGDVRIGKYCQFGYNVALVSNNHPVSYLTTYINENLFNGELKNLIEKGTIVVGNDVWIGHNAVILPNVTIGNGAIIAAGAVVSKSVAPYTVVGGVPAKEIRQRFEDKVIEQLELLQWWDMSEEQLSKLKPLFLQDLSVRHELTGIEGLSDVFNS